MSIIPNINNQSIAILSDIEQWKEDIADAINSRGGTASADDSFQQLATEIQAISSSGILSSGVGLENEFYFLQYFENNINTSIKSINSTLLTDIERSYAFHKNVSLQSVELPNLATISDSNTFYGCSSLQSVEFGRLILIAENFNGTKENLRNVTIGAGTDVNLPFKYWTATNVIAKGQSGIDELNSNLYNNLLTKLYDHSNDGETRILQIGWLDYITPENIAYANAKGWTITN